MEFPIEIQMLINDFLRPITRPDWRQGSFLTRYYRSPKARYGRLLFDEFERYLIRCYKLDEYNEGEDENSELYTTIKSWAFFYEHRFIKNDKHIIEMRKDEIENEDYDY